MKMNVLAVMLLLVAPSFGETRQCRGNPRLVGVCYVVHGRATNGDGTPTIRIWPAGTKRMLGVTAGSIADDADDPIVPKEMLRFTTGVESIVGDFEVCPFTPGRKGEMQMVCVQSATNLVIKRVSSKK